MGWFAHAPRGTAAGPNSPGAARASQVNLTLEPPWHPRLKSADDVSYFDVEGQQEAFDEQVQGDDSVSAEEYAKWQHVWDQFSA